MVSHNESEGVEPRNMSNRIGPRVSPLGSQYLDQLFLIMVSFQVVFRELEIVRKPLLTKKDGIFRRDRGSATVATLFSGASYEILAGKTAKKIESREGMW